MAADNCRLMKLCDLTLPTPEENLAADEALLDLCEAGGCGEVLRFWSPRHYFVVLGYGNKAATEANLPFCREQGIPVRVRTVEAGTFTQELNYSATLGGREESTAQAMVSDIVTSIKAKVGDRVTAGQIIVTFPQNTPAAQYVQASAAFNAQKQAYERMQRLFNQGAIARQDLDNLETGFNVAKANLEAAEKMINVRAPISGVITKIMVNPAERTYPGQDLFTVSSTNGFKATLMIPDTDVSKLRVGTPATAKWMDQTLNGKVSQISMALDPYTKAVRVDVVFGGYSKKISFGSVAQISLKTMTKSNVIVVDRIHITNENDKFYVWLNKDNHAVRREVELGLNNKLQHEVISGLEEGDILITEGINLLTENALIRVVE